MVLIYLLFFVEIECESSQLPRSVSDPLREISPELLTRISNDKRLSG